MRILLLNGPNLNLLGTRAPEVYGAVTLDEVERRCRVRAAGYGHRLEAFQSNHEGALIDAIHAARETADAIVFNPGAYTHTSYALRDAIEAAGVPTVEIHISNVAEREPWRRVSRIEPVCAYRIYGRGVDGYEAAVSHVHHRSTHPPITRRYGDHPDHLGDLRIPAAEGPHPAVVLIHGGGWTGPFTRDIMDGAAVDLAARGFATWNVEYRRIPPVGGWRQTIADVTAAVDELDSMAGEYALDLERATVIGHSAGAHLGFFASKNARLRSVRFAALAGMLDLRRLDSSFDELLARFMGHDLDTHLDAINPIAALPSGSPTVAIHGDRDSDVHPDQSRRFVEAARAAGDEARLVRLPEARHSDLIDPRSSSWEAVVTTCLDQEL